MRKAIPGLMLLVCLTACSDSSTPATPTPTALDLTGTWTGPVTVVGTTATMTWTLSQSNGAVSGPVLLSLPSGTVLLNGFVTGTLTGTSLPYTLTVGPGGIPAQPACVGQLGGTMTATIAAASTLSGPISVTSSTCTPPIPGGTLTLTRR